MLLWHAGHHFWCTAARAPQAALFWALTRPVRDLSSNQRQAGGEAESSSSGNAAAPPSAVFGPRLRSKDRYSGSIYTLPAAAWSSELGTHLVGALLPHGHDDICMLGLLTAWPAASFDCRLTRQRTPPLACAVTLAPGRQ